MTHKIEAAVEIGLTWNDESNEWEVDPADLLASALNWGRDGGEPQALGWRTGHREPLERAQAHPVSAEELTHMLGFAMVRATVPANVDADWRPASPSLVGMLKDTLRHVLGHRVSDEVQGTLVRNLVPIFSSVDENAHRRGMFDQRQAALAEGQS